MNTKTTMMGIAAVFTTALLAMPSAVAVESSADVNMENIIGDLLKCSDYIQQCFNYCGPEAINFCTPVGNGGFLIICRCL